MTKGTGEFETPVNIPAHKITDTTAADNGCCNLAGTARDLSFTGISIEALLLPYKSSEHSVAFISPGNPNRDHWLLSEFHGLIIN